MRKGWCFHAVEGNAMRCPSHLQQSKQCECGFLLFKIFTLIVSSIRSFLPPYCNLEDFYMQYEKANCSMSPAIPSIDFTKRQIEDFENNFLNMHNFDTAFVCITPIVLTVNMIILGVILTKIWTKQTWVSKVPKHAQGLFQV